MSIDQGQNLAIITIALFQSNSEHFGLLTSLLHWGYKLRILGVVFEMTLFFEYGPRSSLHLDKGQVGAPIPRASSPLPTSQTSIELSGKRNIV